MIYKAFGAALPTFAHVPLILGPDKTRLSKRHGATSVVAYRDEGIVPEAFRNYLSVLGWTPQDEAGKEIFTQQELIYLFGLGGISRSNAVFDRAKLDWYNSEYIRGLPAAQLLPLIEAEWKKAGMTPQNTDPAWLHATIDLLKSRARNLRDFAGGFRAFLPTIIPTIPPPSRNFSRRLRSARCWQNSRIATQPPMASTSNPPSKRCADLAAEKNIKAGALINGAPRRPYRPSRRPQLVRGDVSAR